MLGHKVWQLFEYRFDTWVSFRDSLFPFNKYQLFDPDRAITGVDANDLNTIARALAAVHPDIVINCVGIIKQLPSAQDPINSISINSLFPHRLATLCNAISARLIHISTDCVFSGRKGMYKEEDVSDAEDLYGRTKLLGELSSPGCLTLRTSIIGRELSRSTGLVEWFLSNDGGRVKGYSNAIFSGLTTISFANVMAKILSDHPELTGLYHVSTQPIRKRDLLCILNEAYGTKIKIEPYEDIVIDRSLDSKRFWQKIGSEPEKWADMIQEMADDETPYDEWRN